MRYLLFLLALAGFEIVPATRAGALAPAADAARHPQAPRPSQGDRKPDPPKDRGKPSREPERRPPSPPPQAGKGKPAPAPQPTGDPQLKRRKPPALDFRGSP
jgi:hypothetical protein